MEIEEFVAARTKLGKTKKEMSHLLGVSAKAVNSYEQGFRNIPTHVERQTFFLLSRQKGRQELAWLQGFCPLGRGRLY